MKFTSKTIKNSDLEVTINLDKKDLDMYVKKAIDELKDSVKIDGYRSGKAPEELIRKGIGEDRVKENALNIAVQDSINKLIEKENFDVLDYSKIDIKENKPDELRFSVLLTLFPDIQLGNYTGINVKSKPIGVEEEEIDKTIKEIQESRTEFKDSEEAAKKGDRVEVDFEVSGQDGKVIEGGQSENHPLIIGKNTFVPGFEEHLEGMKAGEEKTFSLKMPADYHEKNIAGKEMNFKVVMKKISYPVTPKMDDSFIKGLGNFTSVSQLRETIKSGLFEEKKMKESERIKLAILDEILQGTQVTVPDRLLENQLDIMVGNFDRELHGRGLELGLYLAHLNKTQDEFRKGFLPQAEKQVKINLIMREIGKKESISITPEEVAERLQEINATINLQDEVMKQGLDIETLSNRIRQSIFNEKIFQLLLSKAVITPA